MNSKKQCPNCHTQNEIQTAFCVNCGQSLPEQTQETQILAVVCPICGASVAFGLKFCTACGSSVDGKTVLQPAKRADASKGFPVLWVGIAGGIILLIALTIGGVFLFSEQTDKNPDALTDAVAAEVKDASPSPTLTPKPGATPIPPSPAPTPTNTPLPTPTPTAAKSSGDTFPTATPTSTPQYTATPTPIPLGQNLIYLSALNAADWLAGEQNEDNLLTYSANGEYHFVWPQKGSAARDFYTANHYRDFAVEVSGKQVEGDENYSYGLIFRFANPENYYTAEVSGKYYLIGRMLNDEWSKLIEWTASEALNDDAPNVIRLVAAGDTLTLYGNNVLLTVIEDDSIKSGQAGIYAAGRPGNHVALSEFSLWALPGKEAVISTPTPSVQQAYVSLNKGADSSYAFGEQIEFCFWLNFNARAVATVYEPGGRTHSIGNWSSLGRQKECVSGPVSTKRGWNRVELRAYNQSGSVSASQSISFSVY